MFESLTLTTLLLVLFFFYQNMRWGLTSTIPKDPDARLRFYCSECLTNLKTLLAGAPIQEVESARLRFGENSVLFVRDGNVMLERVGEKERLLQNLGARGSLSFEKLSETGLMVTIQAQEEKAAHRIALRVEVTFPQLVLAP